MYRGKVVWLMQWGEWYVALELRKDFLVHQHGSVVFRSTMYHAMSDTDRIELLRIPQPRPGYAYRGGDVWNLFHRVGLVDERSTCGILGAKSGPRANTIKFTFGDLFEVVRFAKPEDLEFHA